MLLLYFFPSLFNLEQKKIAEYQFSLNTDQDAIKFINFLKEHQDSIVHLDLTYIEKIRYRDAYDKNGKIIIDYDDKFSNAIRPDEALDDGVKKENLNEMCSGEKLDGKKSFGVVDQNGHIFISSEFKCRPFLNNFNFIRKKGSLGIWILGKKDDGSDDENYHIIITNDSKNNTLFKWSIKNREKNIEEMQLTGTFFVNKFIDSHDYGESADQRIAVMSPQLGGMYNGVVEIGDLNMEVVELQPLSQKEIESKNY